MRIIKIVWNIPLKRYNTKRTDVFITTKRKKKAYNSNNNNNKASTYLDVLF